ncbi:MAG: hypothetical protein JXB30_04265 [Anaerolineae bacterium]|nr:hypothetical protein [Anaerolineae bacterium]
MKIIIGILVVLIVLSVVAYLGLQIQPRPFDAYPAQAPKLETVPLPDNLPAPVERFYQTLYGDEIPVIESAVITGRARLRVFGITFPSRFRFTHVAGQDYRHYLEATIYGLPIMKVNEHFLDGKSRLELPFGVVENEPKVDQAANLGLWAESIWFPAIFITDSRVRWEHIDDDTALLIVPFGEDEETFVVRFDPKTGLIHALEAMRYKEVTDEAKTLWINQAYEWQEIDGTKEPVGAVIWLDEGTPWAVFTVEETVFNTDVSDYVRAEGP